MNEKVSAHYNSVEDLVGRITAGLQRAGKNLDNLSAVDLAAIDEFHFRGRKATLQLAEYMNLNEAARVLDIGSGLGGPARTLAEEYGCHVIGIDLTRAFCEVADVMSEWVNLTDRTEFRQGDAMNLPFSEDQFDAAMTIHVAMNLAAKDKMYEQARRVLKPGGIFAVYDILQGEGGEAIYPAPWARNSSISHLATPEEMETLLSEAGFVVLDINDSTKDSLNWLEARTAGTTQAVSTPVTIQILFDDDFPQMVRNQTRGLRERRIRTVSYICEA